MGDSGDGEGQDQEARPGGVSEWTPVGHELDVD